MKKRCHQCRGVLPLDAFHRDPSRRDGRHVWCKLCRRDLRASHPSRVLARQQSQESRRIRAANRPPCPGCGGRVTRETTRENRSGTLPKYCGPCGDRARHLKRAL
jgi:hypothetical protein